MALPTQISERLSSLGTSLAEVEERFVRGTGPGGQKINKTSSTVWLRHRPTGIEVRCQAGRSQAANRQLAWELLCARLEERARRMQATVADEEARQDRRLRQKSRGQKARMVAAKRHRAGVKARRGHGAWDE